MSNLIPTGQEGSRFVDSLGHDDLVDSTAYTFGFSHGGYSYSRRPPGPGDAPYGIPALLEQAEWWRPQSGPPVRVREMTDTHRLHTARYVLNRATFVHEIPAEMVKRSPLFVALLTASPALPLPGDPGWDDMLRRATHWSTCPRNRDLGAPACSPDCKPNTEAWNRPRELMVDGDAAGVNGL